MKTLFRDVETRSQIDIGDVGAHIYAKHPTTEMLCVGYAVDDGPGKLWWPGDPVPPEFIQAAEEGWTVVAHVAEFERAIEREVLSKRHGFPVFKLENQRCTRAICAALALPGKLEKAALALNLEHNKDAVGKKVMLKLSKPRKPTKKEDPNGVYWVEATPEMLAQLGQYCVDDVLASREIYQSVPHLSDDEQKVWEFDQIVNDRGFEIDAELALAAQKIAEAAEPRLNSEMEKLTDGEVCAISEVKKLTAWINQHYPLDALRKADIEDLLDSDEDLPPKVRRALELRWLGAQAAVKKIYSLMNHRDPDDGRLRGAFVYHAAGPGRWSSHGAQIHNMKRSDEDLDYAKAIEVIKTGNFEQACKEYPNPLAIIGKLVRSMIKAKDGHVFMGADFSGIEARVTAWVAGETKKLEVFEAYDRKEGPDPYKIAAASVFKKPALEITKEERQVGKACELAFGYQGGLNAYLKFSPDTQYSEREIHGFKDAWRAAHPNIVNFWGTVNRAAIHAARNHGDICRVKTEFATIIIECDDQPIMWITLPSGRKLAYPHARFVRYWTPAGSKTPIELDPKGRLPPEHVEDHGEEFQTTRPQWGLIFKDNAAGMWRDVKSYGGLLTENIVQAIARDLLAEAMLRVEAAGIPSGRPYPRRSRC